ncbi:unnamed protein product [Ceutorhynchus assimilis]|uniref:EGF-like domain-containing protein n=1 Tax=Ceutorhynchus assimilis TaxID=467358 RepID=A0A9N9QAI2_9CUCU|nr:unnamed protein product [Ceutorhynchus assimilis]
MQGYCNRPNECLCKLGYYGEKCNKCIPLPGCQHGYCNTSFECICQEGWDGLFCSEPICRHDCHQARGYCNVPGDCKCRLGWSGKTCKECQVLPGCVHGYCEKPLECKCHPGYTGILCQTPICSKTCHKERGYCRKPDECRCKVGWWGKNCEKCFAYPGCLNGSCNRPWECNCQKGWGGMLCDEELNHCENNPDTCINGAKCVSLTKDDGLYKCLCREGTYGKNCEMSEHSTTTANQSVGLQRHSTTTVTPATFANQTIKLQSKPALTTTTVKPTKSTKQPGKVRKPGKPENVTIVYAQDGLLFENNSTKKLYENETK